MEVRNYRENNAVIVAVKGKVDAATAPRLDAGFAEALAVEGSTFILDLEELEYISSAGLRSILNAGKKLKSSGRGLFLAAPQDMVKNVLEISGFDALFPTFSTRAMALAQCEG